MNTVPRPQRTPQAQAEEVFAECLAAYQRTPNYPYDLLYGIGIMYRRLTLSRELATLKELQRKIATVLANCGNIADEYTISAKNWDMELQLTITEIEQMMQHEQEALDILGGKENRDR